MWLDMRKINVGEGDATWWNAASIFFVLGDSKNSGPCHLNDSLELFRVSRFPAFQTSKFTLQFFCCDSFHFRSNESSTLSCTPSLTWRDPHSSIMLQQDTPWVSTTHFPSSTPESRGYHYPLVFPHLHAMHRFPGWGIPERKQQMGGCRY
jgi:hypothetical protein